MKSSSERKCECERCRVRENVGVRTRCKHLIEENQPQVELSHRKVKPSIRKSNNCYAISDTSYAVLIEDNEDSTYDAIVVDHCKLENYYGDSLDSTMFGIGRISIQAYSRIRPSLVFRRRLSKKVAMIKHESHIYFVPLLHM